MFFYATIIVIIIGGDLMNNPSLQKAMDNAEASINMEGFFVSDDCKELCEKLLKKEITFEEYMNRILVGAEVNGI